MATTLTTFFDQTNMNGRVQIAIDFQGSDSGTIGVNDLVDDYEIDLLTLASAPSDDLKGIITDGASITADIVEKVTDTTYHISMIGASADFGTNIAITDSNSVSATTHASDAQEAVQNCRVQIERIRWSQASSGVLKLEWHKVGGNELIMQLYGNGHWFNDFAIKPIGLADTDTGDLIASGTQAATLLLDLRKISGYKRRA